MQTTVLPDGRSTSRLGFGCAHLMARLDRRSSRRLIDTAVDNGMRHLDVARSYGYGRAESVVGEAVAASGGSVTVTTKLGITPPSRSRALSAGTSVARAFVRFVPSARERLRDRAAGLSRSGSFSVAEAQASLNTSFAELGLDYVDLLLLHECDVEDLSEDLLEFLEERRKVGQIGSFGCATSREAGERIAGSAPRFASVLQVPDENGRAPRPFDPSGPPGFVITHSSLRNLGRLHAALVDDRAENSQDELRALVRGSDGKARLAELLLWRTMADERNGLVLVSSGDPEHIVRNAAAGDKKGVPGSLLAALSDAESRLL